VPAARPATRSELLRRLRLLLAQTRAGTTGIDPISQQINRKEHVMLSLFLAASLLEVAVYLAALAIFLAIVGAGLAVLVWLVALPTFAATHPEPVPAKELARTPGLPAPPT
jgi:hypothetical protein